MPPISYQGPMAEDESHEHSHSQTVESNLGAEHPGLTVAALLADKGDLVYTTTPHTTVMEAAGEMTRLKVGALVVVNSANEPVGMISERDVSRNASMKGLGIFDGPVEDIMTPDPKTCTPNDRIEDVLRRMAHDGFRHMPVMAAGKLSGIVSVYDLARHRILEVEYEALKMKQAIVG